jgi:hypothetical protein
MRLAQAFGPAMASRTADGVNSAVAFVNILSAHAFVPDPAYGAFSASAGRRPLDQSDDAGRVPRFSGLRVMNVLPVRPTTNGISPCRRPKWRPKALARSIVAGLCDGLEDVWCGDVAQGSGERWRRDPKVLEREMTTAGGAHEQ